MNTMTVEVCRDPFPHASKIMRAANKANIVSVTEILVIAWDPNEVIGESDRNIARWALQDMWESLGYEVHSIEEVTE